MRLNWRDLGMPRADRAHGKSVEVTGFPVAILRTGTADHFLLMAEPGCCAGCTTRLAGSTLRVSTGTTRSRTLRVGRSCVTTT